VKKVFFIYKNKNKVGRNYDCDISRKKNQKMENIFLCLCMLCINQIFFLILAPGLEPPLFWLKNNPFVIPMFRLHFFIHPTKNLKKKHQLHFSSFFACDVLTQSVEKNSPVVILV